MRIYRIANDLESIYTPILEHQNIWSEWAQTDFPVLHQLMRLDEAQLMTIPDATVEKAIFGVASLDYTLDVPVGYIECDWSRQGYDETLQEIEESGAENYDFDDPVTLDWHRNILELNDGHHRYIIATEIDYHPSFEAYIQFSPDQAKHQLLVMKNLLRKRNEDLQNS